jgi:Trypsin-like peptidase domain
MKDKMSLASKVQNRIAAGGRVRCRNKDAVIGAVIKYQDKNCVITVYHLLKVGKCALGDTVKVEGWPGVVLDIILDLDLAVIQIKNPNAPLEFSILAEPRIGPAYALKDSSKNPCQVMTLGRVYHYLAFPFSTIPLPGDSGSPIIQEGRVVGILASVFYNNATGIAVSIKKFHRNNLE